MAMRHMAWIIILAAALSAQGHALNAGGEAQVPECTQLAGDSAVAARLCEALRAALASDPEAAQRFGAARLGLEVVDAAPNRIVARLVMGVADARREGPTLTLDIVDRAELPEKSIVDFARVLIAQTGLSFP